MGQIGNAAEYARHYRIAEPTFRRRVRKFDELTYQLCSTLMLVGYVMTTMDFGQLLNRG